MFGFLKSLFLDDRARRALAKGKTQKGAAAAKAGRGVREQAIRQAQADMRKVMTPELAELIRNAMAVHHAKQQVLADLSDDERAKLVALALRTMMNEGRDPD
jgi:hypothetical protein